MKREYLKIQNKDVSIPALLWGYPHGKVLIEVHGNMSSKEDKLISLLAQQAVRLGYQALSFDLPKHGERKLSSYELTPQNCVSDLRAVYAYARTLSEDVSLFGCSIGAYFSLLAFKNVAFTRTMFLSPVVNMENVIKSMMSYCGISEQRLSQERIINLPDGAVLDYDYYTYVRNNPIRPPWHGAMSILYGSYDNLVTLKEISEFGTKFKAKVDILDKGKHFFSTERELDALEHWAEKCLI